jgi:hypothetical protein
MIKSMTAYADFMSKAAAQEAPQEAPGMWGQIKKSIRESDSNPWGEKQKAYDTGMKTGGGKSGNFGKSEILTELETGGRSPQQMSDDAAKPGTGPGGTKTVSDLTNIKGKSNFKNFRNAANDYKQTYTNAMAEPGVKKAMDTSGTHKETRDNPMGQDIDAIQREVESGFGKQIENEGFNAKDKAASLELGSIAYKGGKPGQQSEYEQMNPSQKLSQPAGNFDKPGLTQSGTVKQIASNVNKDVVQRTKQEYDKRIGDAVGKWGPWVAGLGLGGLGLYLALNQQGQAIQGENAAQAPTGGSDWANEGKWQSGMQQGEEPQAPVADV